MKQRTFPLLVAAGLGLAFATHSTLGAPHGSSVTGGTDSSQQAALTALATTPPHAPAGDNPVASAAAKLEPAIVSVHVVGKPIQQAASPFDNDPLFRQFFGQRQVAPVIPQGAGSGIIISPDGYILTNNHVVANTTSVKVNVGVGNNTKEYTAKVVGTDPMTDVAVIKINPEGAHLTAAALGNSDDVRVGDWAIAVGNPLDVGTTVTLGIVSAKDRRDMSADGQPLSNNLIQTDAAINPGNSGGALANIEGQVIGINEAILSPTGSSVGIGFAIPINSARAIAYQLIKNGKIVRPYLGVSYAPLKTLSADARKQLGIMVTGDHGVVVEQVYPGSPAAAAGLKTYDVIVDANRRPLTDADTLNTIIQTLKVGDSVTLLVSRNGTNRIVTITLRERPDTFGQAPAQLEPPAQPDMP